MTPTQSGLHLIKQCIGKAKQNKKNAFLKPSIFRDTFSNVFAIDSFLSIFMLMVQVETITLSLDGALQMSSEMQE